MDFATEVSSSEFSMLPEDIRAVPSPEQHREYAIEDQVEDVGTKSFNEEEINWLLNIRKTIAIMYEYNGISDIGTLVSKFNSNYLTETTMMYTYVWNDGAKISLQNIKFKDGNEEIKKKAIRNNLVGRYDTQIIRRSKNIISYRAKDHEIFADVIIPDLRSIYILLKRRFNLITDESINLARKYTMIILNRIMDDMQGTRIYALIAYLLTNAIMFDMDININDYVGNFSKEEKTLNEFKNSCIDLYNDISLVVNNMI
jgi:hypothetical protein